MAEYSRPNLSIPSTLWGEVKVAAFRRGVRPVEVVIEILREKFDETYRGEKGLPARASVQRLKDKVESVGGPPPAAKPVVVQSKSIGGVPVGSMVEQPVSRVPEEKPKPDQKTCKHSFAMKPSGGSKCVKCGWEP